MSSVENITLNGLPAVRLTDKSGATCEVYCYGAHVASWKSADGVENLFVSSTAEIGNGKALRGGVPICWPQFAAKGKYGKHGFCRSSDKCTRHRRHEPGV
jgi:glucose-6-phosphate 1-epimerase